MKNQKVSEMAKSFRIPLVVFTGIVIYLVLNFLNLILAGNILILAITLLGSYKLFQDTAVSLLKKRFALDYIAILAIVVSIITNEYLVAAIIALMISSGRTLEEYGVSQAKKSLTSLVDRIPDEIILWQNNQTGGKEKISNIRVGQEIFIRKGEVIGLDGTLVSEAGLTDESSLTGEPYMIDKIKGDQIRSGTINVGDPIVIKVTNEQKDSTYNKILNMVKNAQGEKAPLVRLADRYSTIFTAVTLAISAFAYVYSGGDLQRVLAVLVIATPCPLILATPIALMGGVSAAAKKRIIVKKLASIEALSRAKSFIFDKTGTITIGTPKLAEIEIIDKKYSEKEILSIAEAIERNSLHPLAKTIVAFAKQKEAPSLSVTEIKEKIGSGISGKVKNQTYALEKEKNIQGMSIAMTKGNKKIAVFRFEDEIKEDSREIIKKLKAWGIEVSIFTGDKLEAAKRVAGLLGEDVSLRAECTPEEKQEGIMELKKQGKTTAMIGDGINDAPALALADVGIVFSNEEQTAASEAADVVFLGNDFSLVLDALNISKQTIRIALQSILWGIGISVGGMVFASVGLIPPIAGAFLQEAIDVAVIINALRSSRIT